MSRPELSLCMIVRDEQEMLPGFLTAVKGLWDELVVVDTGSRDQTISLLEEAGARVTSLPWRDDFSAARNASLERATGRWILFLDADERPSEEIKGQIRQLLQDQRAGAATLVMRNQWADGSYRETPLLRLFRNQPTVRFQYRIHEDISTSVRDYLAASHLALRHLPGVVSHLGYQRSVVRDRGKKERDLALLQRSLEQDPRDFYCWFKILEIARFWSDTELWQQTASKAAEKLETATQAEKDDLKKRPFSEELAALVAVVHPADDEARLQWLEKSREFCRPGPHWSLRRGLLLENLERWDEAEESFRRVRGLDGQSGAATMGLCRLAMRRARWPQATEMALAACHQRPENEEGLLAAISCLQQTRRKGQPEKFIREHVQQFPATRLVLGQVLVQTAELELGAEVLRPLAQSDPQAALGYLLCSLVLNREVDLKVDIRPEQAREQFQQWISLLWDTRRTELMVAFADHCAPVADIFPWLADFLGQETRRVAALISN